MSQPPPPPTTPLTDQTTETSGTEFQYSSNVPLLPPPLPPFGKPQFSQNDYSGNYSDDSSTLSSYSKYHYVSHI